MIETAIIALLMLLPLTAGMLALGVLLQLLPEKKSKPDPLEDYYAELERKFR